MQIVGRVQPALLPLPRGLYPPYDCETHPPPNLPLERGGAIKIF